MSVLSSNAETGSSGTDLLQKVTRTTGLTSEKVLDVICALRERPDTKSDVQKDNFYARIAEQTGLTVLELLSVFDALPTQLLHEKRSTGDRRLSLRWLQEIAARFLRIRSSARIRPTRDLVNLDVIIEELEESQVERTGCAASEKVGVFNEASAIETRRMLDAELEQMQVR